MIKKKKPLPDSHEKKVKFFPPLLICLLICYLHQDPTHHVTAFQRRDLTTCFQVRREPMEKSRRRGGIKLIDVRLGVPPPSHLRPPGFPNAFGGSSPSIFCLASHQQGLPISKRSGVR